MRALAALTFVSIATAARAFAPCQSVHTNARPTAAAALEASPLDTIFSVLKKGKIGLVESLAGDYDEVAIQSKLDSLVKKNPVLMLSFTT